MRKAALWLAAAGSIVYLGALGIHAAHSEGYVGKVTEPTPAAWKLRVTISTKDGATKGTMVMVNPDHTPRLWLSLDACKAFMDTDEYKQSLPPLAEYLIGQGFDPDDGTAFTCVPAQPTIPLVQ